MDARIDHAGTAGIVTKQRLRARWAELLGIREDEISGEQNFFMLGGDSMLLLSLHNCLAQEFGMTLDVAELIDNAGFDSMAHLIHNRIS